MRHIASVSFGKDSLAMLLLLLEKEMPLDEVIFFNSGMEFQAIYDIRDQVRPKAYRAQIKQQSVPARQRIKSKVREK